MEIIMKFDSLTDARDALDGSKWKQAMWELDQELRNTIKYDDSLPGDIAEAYEKIREKIREITNDYGINLYN